MTDGETAEPGYRGRDREGGRGVAGSPPGGADARPPPESRGGVLRTGRKPQRARAEARRPADSARGLLKSLSHDRDFGLTVERARRFAG